MKNVLHLSEIVILTTLLVSFKGTAISHEINEPLCYLRTRNGEIVDLSRICGTIKGGEKEELRSDLQVIQSDTSESPFFQSNYDPNSKTIQSSKRSNYDPNKLPESP